MREDSSYDAPVVALPAGFAGLAYRCDTRAPHMGINLAGSTRGPSVALGARLSNAVQWGSPGHRLDNPTTPPPHL